jgi:hypothetical protein
MAVHLPKDAFDMAVHLPKDAFDMAVHLPKDAFDMAVHLLQVAYYMDDAAALAWSLLELTLIYQAIFTLGWL